MQAQSKSKTVKLRRREESKSFQLTVNYRSHGGIVDCASSIISVITDLFPYSIDAMGRESGIVSGAKPTFFEPSTKGNADYTQLLTGKSYVARY
jgi:hypothetical protein